MADPNPLRAVSLVTVVVPAFKSTDSLGVLASRVHTSLALQPHEIVIVDDGSPAPTWQAIERLASSDPSVRGIRLGRNAGQHNALLAGISAAVGDVIVTIDDDLQNPPEEIPRLLDALAGDIDVVYGTPVVVAQRGWRKRSSAWMRTLMTSALGVEHAERMSSFRAFRANLRDGFDSDLGPGVSIDALLSWSTSRFRSVDVDHETRFEGRSNYTFRRLLRFAFDTATGYSSVPLQLALSFGLLAAMLGFLMFGWVVIRALAFGSDVPGFPFLAATVSLFAGVQLITIGIIGEYLARVHFRVMRKPSYVVAEETAAGQPARPDPA